MRLTRRGQILVGLTLGAATMLGGTQALPSTPENTPIIESPTGREAPDGYDVEIYEDGSGVQYDAYGQEVRTFPADTFWWDCTHMGNGICGTQPE